METQGKVLKYSLGRKLKILPSTKNVVQNVIGPIFVQKVDFEMFENYSKCRIWILAFSTNFCPIKSDLSGNTVWPQASGFQKLDKKNHFWHF